MALFLLRRIGVMVLTAFCLTFVVFFLTNLYPNLEKLAKSEGNNRMKDHEVSTWLSNRGFRSPIDADILEKMRNDTATAEEIQDAVMGFDQRLFVNYGEWLGILPGYRIEGTDGKLRARCAQNGTPDETTARYCGLLQGYWGFSTVYKKPIVDVIIDRLGKTGILMFWVMMLMVPGALIIGVLAGMREGSRTDRSLSTVAIASTATPEYVSGVIFIALLASSKAGLSPILAEWGWIDGKTLFKGTAAAAASKGPTFENFFLPVLTIALYGMGYIARMTRASMTEVMNTQYIRTARLKGVKFRNIVIKHALRNALIAPFTVIMLQFPWLLNGVVIVELIFSYKGFGDALVQAAGNNDIDLLLACSVVAVVIVLVTQLISDIGYVFLNPRIRIA